MENIELLRGICTISGTIGDHVYYNVNGKTYVRKKGVVKTKPTEKQLQVRRAFAELNRDWTSLKGIMQTCWNSCEYEEGITGHGAFLKQNFQTQREGKPLVLFKQLGQTGPPEFTAAPGAAGEIDCSFTLPPDAAEHHLHFFVKMKKGKVREIKRFSAGPGAASPYKIAGLKPGAEHHIYAVLTDLEYNEATEVSSSTSFTALAGK